MNIPCAVLEGWGRRRRRSGRRRVVLHSHSKSCSSKQADNPRAEESPCSSLVSPFIAPIRAVGTFRNVTAFKVKLGGFILCPHLCGRAAGEPPLSLRAVAEFPSSWRLWPVCIICFCSSVAIWFKWLFSLPDVIRGSDRIPS